MKSCKARSLRNSEPVCRAQAGGKGAGFRRNQGNCGPLGDAKECQRNRGAEGARGDGPIRPDSGFESAQKKRACHSACSDRT